MKEPEFSFFGYACCFSRGRHGHWFDVLRRSRTDCPLISSFADQPLPTGTNEKAMLNTLFHWGIHAGYL